LSAEAGVVAQPLLRQVESLRRRLLDQSDGSESRAGRMRAPPVLQRRRRHKEICGGPMVHRHRPPAPRDRPMRRLTVREPNRSRTRRPPCATPASQPGSPGRQTTTPRQAICTAGPLVASPAYVCPNASDTITITGSKEESICHEAVGEPSTPTVTNMSHRFCAVVAMTFVAGRSLGATEWARVSTSFGFTPC
jgi:hypothetical protein